MSLLTLSVCLITPRVATAAVIGLTPEEEVAASKEAVTLGEKAATRLATAIWWVAARDRVIRLLTAAGSFLVLGGAANAHWTADTARTELFLALGFGLFAAALFFGFISIVLDTATARSSPQRRLAVWLSSARPAILLGSVAFLVGTGLQLVATFRH